MADKDLKNSKRTVTSTVTMEQKSEKPPASAIIKSQTVRTSTEEIENGWLVTKNYNGYYWKDKSEKEKDSYGNYFNYDLKWYSKEDPLTITVNDKSLADAFNDSDNVD